MRYLSKLILCCCLGVCSLVADDAVEVFSPEKEQLLRFIFHKNYLNDADNMIAYYAAKIVAEANTATTSSELVNKFKEITKSPEEEKRYLEILAKQFSDQELKDVCELLNNDLYMKYRNAILEANGMCFMESIKVLDKLALANSPSAAVPQNPAILHMAKDNAESILNSSRFLVVDVYTDWCGPCKFLSPIFNELSLEYGHLYAFAKLNAETEEEVAGRFQVTGLPTILFIKDGKEVGRHAGFMSKEKFSSLMEKFFTS